MIYRCYDPKLADKEPTYRDCYVDESWHDFQVFAEWYKNHESYGLGYQLDKDLLVQGNRLYSAATCCLLPRELNTMVQTRNSNSILVGTTFHKKSGKWQAQTKSEGKQLFLGLFSDRADAHLAYIEAKERVVRNAAEEWREKIEIKAYKALINWRVNPK